MFKRLTSLFVNSNDKELKRLEPTVRQINALEPDLQRLSDAELRARAEEFKKRLADGETLDDLLPEVFACVREAARRTLGERHYDVQLMGGIVLHQGKIAEMKTGEGKTLVATLAITLNALEGKGTHVVTVNDYLAKRDPRWMGPIYHLMGLSVGCIQHESAFLYDPEYPTEDPGLQYLRPVSRREAYQADITYGTNNEFGFDYLRDNMVADLSQCVQRELNYAIVDEVDSILIDEARTPLIISAPAAEAAQKYRTFAQLTARLHADDYSIDEKLRTVILTPEGIGKLEKWLNLPNLYDPSYYGITHYIENALRARVLYQRDRDYVVKDGEVVIVDEFTGRLMLGRRYSEGLHQAIEAKEGVKIQRESMTMATITFQNLFRLYRKLAGMTGTAATEAEELNKIYGLDVVAIPTNVPLIRTEHRDRVYKNEEAKYRAVVQEIEELHAQGRPVLVGTVSVEKSERLSELLRRKGVPHQVLNAKHHEKEAGIVAQAGRLGMVTIATNMAGRGTDIILGGNPKSSGQSPEEWQEEHNKVVQLGGLHIIGTERHEARRIDNQLRGRAGRQGDPGSSRFYVSLEDDILRRFAGDAVRRLIERFGWDENVAIEHALINKSIESAQSKVEAHNFDIRKHLLDYDDVMNQHREHIYAERRKILGGADLKGNVQDMIQREIHRLVASHLTDEHGENWDLEGLVTALTAVLPLPEGLNQTELARMSRGEVEEKLLEHATALYEERERELGAENMRVVERMVTFRAIDSRWVEHLTVMDNMRQEIGLQAYGQRDPLIIYKREAHAMYQNLMASIERDIVHTIYHVGIVKEGEATRAMRLEAEGRSRQAAKVGAKVGRNDPCPCGSGKKYKKCHGK